MYTPDGHSMKFNRIPWTSMEFHGIPCIWNSWEFHGVISHRCSTPLILTYMCLAEYDCMMMYLHVQCIMLARKTIMQTEFN